jgi:hypothetical protein
MADAENEDAVRAQILKMLRDDGLTTQVDPFPQNTQEFDAILTELREPEHANLEDKLVIGGFVHHPVDDQRCLECIYYLIHRKYCDLPELAVPVEPDWWCRLWRI